MPQKQRFCGWLVCFITITIVDLGTSESGRGSGVSTTAPERAGVVLQSVPSGIQLGNGSQDSHPDGHRLSDAAQWLHLGHGRTRKQIVVGRTRIYIVVDFNGFTPTSAQRAAFNDAAVSQCFQ